MTMSSVTNNIIMTSVEQQGKGFEHETTALSASVKKLLCSTGIGVWIDDQDFVKNIDPNNQVFLNKNELVNIKDCSKCLALEGGSKDSSYFSRAAFILSPTFRECENVWSLMSLEEFSSHYKQYFEWTGNTQLFIDTFELLKQNCDSKDVLALLLLCSGIEHSLRNIYALENEQCPLLLKDLLVSKELQKHLGEDATQLLQVLIGPPISMNLRNVAWHGFFSEGEIPTRYTYFLLILMASLSSHSLSNIVDVCSLNPKKEFSLCKADCINKSFPDLSDGLLHAVKESVMKSWVTGERNKGLIQDIFDLHHGKKYGFSSVQAFPILEHALRRQFVKVNDCMHRLLTAEATTLYTTYEEILDCYLPDSSDNKLIHKLGEPFLDLLHDLLIYPSGPRARDRLGHGEADVYGTPPSLSSVVIICLGYLAVKGTGKNDQQMVDPGLQKLIACVDGYESQFHPVTELKGKIQSLSLTCTDIHGCLRTDPDLQSWNPASEIEIFIKDNPTFHQIKISVNDLLSLINENCQLWDDAALSSELTTCFGNVHNFVKEAFKKRTSTLHRWQRKEKCPKSNVSENEIIGLMHRVVMEMFTVLDQMEAALQQRQEALDNRQLRSRQRDNMKRLILLIPNMILAANYLSILWTWLFDFLVQPNTGHFKQIQKFLKSMLQLVENLRTYTSSDNNKWSKADEVLLTFVQTGVEFVRQF